MPVDIIVSTGACGAEYGVFGGFSMTISRKLRLFLSTVGLSCAFMGVVRPGPIDALKGLNRRAEATWHKAQVGIVGSAVKNRPLLRALIRATGVSWMTAPVVDRPVAGRPVAGRPVSLSLLALISAGVTKPKGSLLSIACDSIEGRVRYRVESQNALNQYNSLLEKKKKVEPKLKPTSFDVLADPAVWGDALSTVPGALAQDLASDLLEETALKVTSSHGKQRARPVSLCAKTAFHTLEGYAGSLEKKETWKQRLALFGKIAGGVAASYLMAPLVTDLAQKSLERVGIGLPQAGWFGGLSTAVRVLTGQDISSWLQLGFHRLLLGPWNR